MKLFISALILAFLTPGCSEGGRGKTKIEGRSTGGGIQDAANKNKLEEQALTKNAWCSTSYSDDIFTHERWLFKAKGELIVEDYDTKSDGERGELRKSFTLKWSLKDKLLTIIDEDKKAEIKSKISFFHENKNTRLLFESIEEDTGDDESASFAKDSCK